MTHLERRSDCIAARVSEAPASAQNTLSGSFSGAASPRAAIKAMCLAWTGYERLAVQNCTGWSCPLWVYRPYQGKGAS